MDAKRQRLKNKEETSTISMDTTENNLEDNGTAPIRADVDLAEDKPTTTAQTMACNQGLLDSSKEFTRSPHPILKAQTEPEFEGELLLSITFTLYLSIKPFFDIFSHLQSVSFIKQLKP